MDNTTKVLLFSSIGVAVLVGVVIVVRNKNAATNIQYSNGNILDNSNGDVIDNFNGGVIDNINPSSGLNSSTSILDKYSANSWVTTTKSTIVSAIPQVDVNFNKPPIPTVGNGKPKATDNKILPIGQTPIAIATYNLIDELEKKGSRNERNLVKPFRKQYDAAISARDNIGLATSLTNATNLMVQGIYNRYNFMDKENSDKREAARINLLGGVDTINSAGVLITLFETGKI